MSAIDVALWDIVGKKLAAKKIAGTAEAYYVNIAPHNPNGPICPAASLHLATSIANFLILGQGATNTSAYREIFPGGWKESLSEMWVPEVPGIGVDFSPAYVEEHAVTLWAAKGDMFLLSALRPTVTMAHVLHRRRSRRVANMRRSRRQS